MGTCWSLAVSLSLSEWHPVARVKSVEKKKFGVYQSLVAEPTVDFSRLEEVLIILTDAKDCDTGAAGARRGKNKGG